MLTHPQHFYLNALGWVIYERYFKGFPPPFCFGYKEENYGATVPLPTLPCFHFNHQIVLPLVTSFFYRPLGFVQIPLQGCETSH